MNITKVLESRFFNELVNNVVTEEYEVVTRPSAFVFCKKNEGGRDVHRIIVLPPKGYTSNVPGQMNSHDEAEYAKIEVIGAIRPGREGFSKIKNCLKIISAYEDGSVSDLTQPYLTYNESQLENHVEKKLISAGESPVTVVKPDGYGFYHNLVNTSNEWLVLKLHKKLRPQQAVNLTPILEKLTLQERRILEDFYMNIKSKGDTIFQVNTDSLEDIYSLKPHRILPALSNMLYVHDSGKHEACSVFAVILNIGKRYPDLVQEFLEDAIDQKSIPDYYAEQLIRKIQNHAHAENSLYSKIDLEM